MRANDGKKRRKKREGGGSGSGSESRKKKRRSSWLRRRNQGLKTADVNMPEEIPEYGGRIFLINLAIHTVRGSLFSRRFGCLSVA